MDRLRITISSLTAMLILLFTPVASGKSEQPDPCRTCHEDVYAKARSYRYQHSVVWNKCPSCHINPDNGDTTIANLNPTGYQKEWLLYAGQLSDDEAYQAEVTVTDRRGVKAAPHHIAIVPKNLQGPGEQQPLLVLKELSGVMIEEVKKRAFVRVTLSWNTNVFASTELVYRLLGSREHSLKIKGLYTKKHTMKLDGLRQKKRYAIRAVSRDIFDNVLKSEEYIIDTSKELSRPAEPEGDAAMSPQVTHMQLFRSPDQKGVYLKVSANKMSELSVTIKQSPSADEKHGPGFLTERYSRIDICYTCHPHDSSHPVGVKAESPKIKTPDGLPTIQDGIITCVTCHEPHGGERVYFNRFDYKKNLCMRCHLKKYGT